jgi:hypothetical protein
MVRGNAMSLSKDNRDVVGMRGVEVLAESGGAETFDLNNNKRREILVLCDL